MKTFIIIILCVIFFHIRENECNVGEDIKNFFSDTWQKIKAPFTRTIERPGRRRKLRYKTTTILDLNTTTVAMTEFRTQATFTQELRKLPIPVLQTPSWRGMDHWKLLQKPKYALTNGINYESRRRMMAKWAKNYSRPRPSRVPQKSYTTSNIPQRTTTIKHTPILTHAPKFAHRIKLKDGKNDLFIPIVLKTTYLNHENTLTPIEYYEIVK